MGRSSGQFQSSWDETLPVLQRNFTFFKGGRLQAETASWDCWLLRKSWVRRHTQVYLEAYFPGAGHSFILKQIQQPFSRVSTLRPSTKLDVVRASKTRINSLLVPKKLRIG